MSESKKIAQVITSLHDMFFQESHLSSPGEIRDEIQSFLSRNIYNLSVTTEKNDKEILTFYLNHIFDNIFNCYHPEYIEDSDHFVEEWLPNVLIDSETRHVNESKLVSEYRPFELLIRYLIFKQLFNVYKSYNEHCKRFENKILDVSASLLIKDLKKAILEDELLKKPNSMVEILMFNDEFEGELKTLFDSINSADLKTCLVIDDIISLINSDKQILKDYPFIQDWFQSLIRIVKNDSAIPIFLLGNKLQHINLEQLKTLHKLGLSFDIPERDVMQKHIPYYAAIGLECDEPIINYIGSNSNLNEKNLQEIYYSKRYFCSYLITMENFFPPYDLIDDLNRFDINLLNYLFKHDKEKLLKYKPGLWGSLTFKLNEILYGKDILNRSGELVTDLPSSLDSGEFQYFFEFANTLLKDSDFFDNNVKKRDVLDIICIVYKNYELEMYNMSESNEASRIEFALNTNQTNGEIFDNLVEKFSLRYKNTFFKAVFDWLEKYSPCLQAIKLKAFEKYSYLNTQETNTISADPGASLFENANVIQNSQTSKPTNKESITLI